MFSGIQEILVLVIIILAIFFLPRILSRGQATTQVAVQKPAATLSGKMRLAIAVSVLWPAGVAAFLRPWREDLILFLYFGLGPVAVCWIFFWVFTGFRKK